jgi:hypothetical protein
MKTAALMYTALAALLAFAVGGIQSCVDRMRVKAVTPEQRVIPAREFAVDALPFPSEYEEKTWRIEGADGEVRYYATHDDSGERVAL